MSDLLADLADLVQKEMQLAKAEITEKIASRLRASVWMAAAALLGFIAALLIVQAAVFAIASFGLALHWSCLLVAAILAAAAAAAFYHGRSAAEDDVASDANGEADRTRHQDSQGATDMSRYSENDTYSQTGDWLMGTARRNPEALLLLAAGACLLMRSGGNSSSRRASQARYGEEEGHQSGSEPASRHRPTLRRTCGKDCHRPRRAPRITPPRSKTGLPTPPVPTRTPYPNSPGMPAATYPRARPRLSRQAQSTLQSGMNRVLSDQPLAVAIAGFAAGAAVAAVFPSTAIEDRTLSGAREALTEAAGKAGERVMGAAGKVGERLMSAAEERGLTSEGLKEVAGEVADTFSDAVSGKADPHAGASVVPKSPASGGGSGRASGTSPGQWDNRGTTGSVEPGGRGSR